MGEAAAVPTAFTEGMKLLPSCWAESSCDAGCTSDIVAPDSRCLRTSTQEAQI